MDRAQPTIPRTVFQEMGGWRKLLTGQPCKTDIMPGRWRVVRLTVLEYRRIAARRWGEWARRVEHTIAPGRRRR